MQSMTKGGVHATATRRCQMNDRVQAGAGAPSSRLARQTNDEAHDRQVRAPACMLPRLLTLLLPPHLRSPLPKRARSAGCGISATSASAEKLREASTVRAVEASSLQPVSARCTATSNGDGARGVDTARDATKAPFSPRMPRSCAGEKADSLKIDPAMIFAKTRTHLPPSSGLALHGYNRRQCTAVGSWLSIRFCMRFCMQPSPDAGIPSTLFNRSQQLLLMHAAATEGQ